MSIAENIHKYRENVKPATLVAVSKTKPKEAIEEAYAAGQRVFGENRVQELVDKYEALPKDIEWHLIGHLQRNKVKYIAPFVSLIHAVDSVRLLEEIQKQAEINQRKIPVLLQMHIAEESEKFGFSEEELMRFLDDGVASEKYPNVLFSGMMGMA
ncbi:MAG: YggS family pyridoxal phosphate-dependent enzyme, partial [Flavobacteriales bacterium]|nr:YggS family pyridoxal phosphate-dependent enzyme [Flavobacteriales bacterium]